jgi:hypothetical protein
VSWGLHWNPAVDWTSVFPFEKPKKHFLGTLDSCGQFFELQWIYSEIFPLNLLSLCISGGRARLMTSRARLLRELAKSSRP